MSILSAYLTTLKCYYFLPLVVAAIMSYLSSRYIFVGSALSLLPWGILALCWGLLASNKKQAKQLGAMYGFFQSFIFLWIDKAGGITFIQFLLLVVIITTLSLAAALCAAVAARISFAAKEVITR